MRLLVNVVDLSNCFVQRTALRARDVIYMQILSVSRICRRKWLRRTFQLLMARRRGIRLRKMMLLESLRRVWKRKLLTVGRLREGDWRWVRRGADGGTGDCGGAVAVSNLGFKGFFLPGTIVLQVSCLSNKRDFTTSLLFRVSHKSVINSTKRSALYTTPLLQKQAPSHSYTGTLLPLFHLLNATPRTSYAAYSTSVLIYLVKTTSKSAAPYLSQTRPSSQRSALSKKENSTSNLSTKPSSQKHPSEIIEWMRWLGLDRVC